MITIATLKAAGLTAEQIVAVLETVETELASSDEARRTKNRDRMRAARALRALCAANSAHNANAAHTDSPLTYLLPSSLLTSSESQPKEEKEVKKERAKRDRGHVCPDDMRPSESHFEAGQRQGFSRPRVEACCEAMKSWSKANANRPTARKVDWNAALFGWISREAERTGKVNGHIGKPNQNGVTGTAAGDRARELSELAREREIAAGIGRPPDAF